MRRIIPLIFFCCALACLPYASQAQEPNYTSTQTVSSGNSWNGNYWQLNGAGALVGPPTAGNTYELVSNGTAFGNSAANTRTRNPAVTGVQTFPGDSLTLDANTELRMKNNGSILNFPGVNGNPGLILNGGVINVGDDGNFPITGSIEVAAQSYLCPGNNGGGGLSANARSMDIQGQLSGSGDLVFFEASLQAPQKISGNSNTFSGEWIVKAGWLVGAGTNALGTNNITIDPGFVLPAPPFSTSAPIVEVRGPAQLEVDYDIKSAGTLILTNGGMFVLHQNCSFVAAIIEGTPLTGGAHAYADLATQFTNFPAGGSGSIIVQPYGPEPYFTCTDTVGIGDNWNGNHWELNGSGPEVGPPTNGATYALVFNGTAFGNALNDTRMRNPAVSGVQTFPGDSLTVNTNTEIRMKNNGSILNFPGVNGNPGLILNGGVINVGDDGNFPITGTIEVASQSYLCPGNNGGGGLSANARSMDIQGQLSGSGTLICFEASLQAAQRISCNSNTFSGQWIVKAGWLLGAGTNSLGTNSITIDPAFGLPEPPLDSSIVEITGPAQLEVDYDINSAGTLILTNGGVFVLHQNCCFSAVVIEGTALTPGTHAYADLAALYPVNLPAGGSGTITVQPYGKPPALAPTITTEPAPEVLYAGRTATFTVAATGQPPLTYHWQRNGSNLTDGGNVSGSTNATLILTNVSTGDVASYDVAVTGSGKTVYSSAVSLTVLPAPTEPYASAVLAANPVAFYQFNETGDPSTNAYAFDEAGGFVGTYGAGVENGNPADNNITGPSSAQGFPGFSAGNKAAAFANTVGNSRVTLPAFNLGSTATNVTITAWVNPTGPQVADEGIVFCRAGTTVAGLCYSGSTDPNGNFTLGYNWNNDPGTYDWNSQLAPPPGQWSFVALVVTPSNAVIHVMNANGLAYSTFWHNHVGQAFNGATLIGDDSYDAGNGTRVFNGTIDDVAIFDSALSDSQLITLYSAASGITQFAPYIAVQPLSTNLYPGMLAEFDVAAGGSEPLSFQWQGRAAGSGAFTNLADGGRIAGSATSILTINNLAPTDGGDFRVVITNAYGALTSTLATLTMLPTGPAETITMSNQQAAGTDWNNGPDWSDGNPASISAFEYPGSTYEVLPGARLRTPLSVGDAVFPGDLLTIDGDGVFTNSPAAGAPAAEIRFKQPTSGSSVTFKKLVMNGGQLDLGVDGILVIMGEIDIVTNTPMYVDSGGDANRQFQIDALLTGAGSIEWVAFDASLTGVLNVTCTSNTYTGTWKVDQGVLLGTGLNSLGTNNITIGTNGVLETAYPIDNPHGSLYLNGRMFLTQNDIFKNVVIDGTPLTNGIYPFAQLNKLYPAAFPATWTGVGGTTNVGTASGSINVGNVTPPPVNVTLLLQRSGATFQLTWPQGVLLQADEVTGPWTTNTATSPFIVSPTAPQRFYRVIVR
jgi:hypothetical protein